MPALCVPWMRKPSLYLTAQEFRRPLKSPSCVTERRCPLRHAPVRGEGQKAQAGLCPADSRGRLSPHGYRADPSGVPAAFGFLLPFFFMGIFLCFFFFVWWALCLWLVT